MAFGLVSAPATFSRLMRKLLHGMESIDNFLDDIIVFTKTWEEHLQVLRELFMRLRRAKLTARPSKCSIGFRQLDCLGHVVGGDKLQPHPDKVKSIEEAPRPVTKRQVRSFLGLIGFYRKFVPNFSEVAAPLTDLTKKGQQNKVNWEAAQENAFCSLKRALVSSPVLKLVDLSENFILQTDASESGLGAVLLQKEADLKMPVAYASRKLKLCEKSILLLRENVWALSGRYRNFLGIFMAKNLS